MENLYHLTDEKNVEKIKREGLKPMIGENSKMVGEIQKAIYLSTREMLPYWQIIIGKPIILEINASYFHDEYISSGELGGSYFQNSYMDSRKFGITEEYFITREIPASYLSFPDNSTFKIPQRIYEEVCLGYLIDISRLCQNAAAAEQYHKESFCYISNDAAGILSVLKRLDYNRIEERKIFDFLQDFGNDGEYTLADTYMNTETKLWEMLKKYQYPDSKSKNIMYDLHDWILSNIPWRCLKMNTGGWTG